MPTLPLAIISSAPPLPTLTVAVSTLSIISWPAYICAERPKYLGAAGAAAAALVSSVLDESQAERPRAANRPTARITQRIDILPFLIGREGAPGRGCAASFTLGRGSPPPRPWATTPSSKSCGGCVMGRGLRVGVCAAALSLALPGLADAARPPVARPWMNPRLSPDARAELVLAKLSLDQQIALLHGSMPMFLGARKPANVAISAGYMPGVPELGIPDLTESDASLGVANAGRKDDDAAPLPSGMALAATWDPQTAFASGAMIGREARQKGFNTLLAGGANLLRDPRNGRNFEYLGEDPLLTGTLAGAAIRGIQSNHIVSTVKHFALNDQETGRMVLDARIDEAEIGRASCRER